MKTFPILFKESFNLYKNNFKFLTLIMLLSNFVGVLLSDIIGRFTPQISTVFYSQSANFALLTFIFIVSWILIFLGNIATLVAIKDLKQEQKKSIPSVYIHAIKLFFPVIIVSISQLLIIMGGFLLLVGPGIIFSIWYMFAFYSAVVHNKRKTEALALSKAIVRKSMGRAIGYSLLAWIIIYGPYIIVNYIINKYLIYHTFSYISGIFVSGVIDSILTVWLLTFSFIFYLDLIKVAPEISREFRLESNIT